MEIFQGFRTVGTGVCIGKVRIESTLFGAYTVMSDKCSGDEVSVSLYERYLSALIELKCLLTEKLDECEDADTREIIESQLMLLDDDELDDEIKSFLSLSTANADTVSDIYTAYAKRIFSDTLTEFFRLRAEDFICLGMIISNIMHRDGYYFNEEDEIVFCDHVLLSHVLLDSKIVGVVEHGHISATHASMLLKARGIPAIEGVYPNLSWEGRMAVLDADNGKIILDPTEEVILSYRAQRAPKKTKILAAGDIPAGIKLMATLNTVEDALTLSETSDVSVNVGLIRTEMMFINNDRLPDEENQYLAYKQIADVLPNRILTFRSFDFGGDKFDIMPESWKMQGITRDQKGVSGTLAADNDFQSQIRAIIRLSRHCKARLLFPYITSTEQLSLIDELIKTVYSEEKHLDLIPIEKGFMIENTSALDISNEIIAHSDFVSVGTNDLLKSLFPIVLDNGYDVLKDDDWSYFASVIHELAKTVHKANKPLILCGEVVLKHQLRPYLGNINIDAISLTTQFLKGVF